MDVVSDRGLEMFLIFIAAAFFTMLIDIQKDKWYTRIPAKWFLFIGVLMLILKMVSWIYHIV